MHLALSSVIRKATRKDGERLNIITFPTHERYQSNMADVNANFYLINHPKMKKWNNKYASLPENHFILNESYDFLDFPKDVVFDGVLSQSKYAQYDAARKISNYFHIPLICLEHTCMLDKTNISENKTRAEDISLWCENNRKKIGVSNIFISNYSVNSWRFEGDPIIVHHGIDTRLFDNKNIKRKNQVLSVVNDWKNRDAECGYYIWLDITKGLPVKVVGDNPGLSESAKDVYDLVDQYNQSSIFLNTAIFSPIPTVLLEAMACGCCIISTKCGMVGEIIENGINGFISDDKNELRKYIELCLNDEDLCRKMGSNARRTIVEKFSLSKFVENWNKALKISVEKNWWNL